MQYAFHGWDLASWLRDYPAGYTPSKTDLQVCMCLAGGCYRLGCMAAVVLGWWLLQAWLHGCRRAWLVAATGLAAWLPSCLAGGCYRLGCMAAVVLGWWLLQAWLHGCR